MNLTHWLPTQRWFAAKGREITDVVELNRTSGP